MFEELVIHTKLTPPHPRRRTLHRPRMTARLCKALDNRLSIVHAATGYGKSTALAALADQNVPLCWYSVSDEDADPFVFLLHLIYACRVKLTKMSDAPLAVLERRSDQFGPNAWKSVVNALVNALSNALDGPTLLVIDDFHLAAAVSQIAAIVDRLIDYAPSHLHVILSGRRPPSLPGLVARRVRGELLEIDHHDLAFTPEEVMSLFERQYGHCLTRSEVETLMEETEGWAIALQLVWQGLRSGAITNFSSRAASPGQQSSLENLFTFLAQEVFNNQPSDVQHFLRTTSVLRHMTPPACNALIEIQDSVAMLRYLQERDLFLVQLGDSHYRYHHLFHTFLCRQLSPDAARLLHRRAADFYCSTVDEESALFHFLSAESYEQAAVLLDHMGEQLVRQGRLDTLAGWIDRLPPTVLEEHPELLTCMGDIARLHSNFDEALGWYTQAEAIWRTRDDRLGTSRALQRQALIYLDTVRPAQAESILAAALRLNQGLQDREDRARLLDLLAENKLNMGRPEEADHLCAQARQWRDEGPSERQLGIRVLIRTGQLDRARAALEAEAGNEHVVRDLSALGRAHRSHREVQLLLSLVYAFQGEPQAAFDAARAGIAIGQNLNSPFVTAIGYMRLGHAWLISSQGDAHLRAIECYKKAIDLGDVVAVRRTRVEAQWGLCRAFGFYGDLAAAKEAATLGIQVGRRAGDLWVVGMIELMLGASCMLAGQYAEAAAILQRVVATFRDCSDTYGRTAALLWLGLAHLGLGRGEHLAETADELLHLTETYGYHHLFTRRALLAPPDNRLLVPLLIHMRRRLRRLGTVDRLLGEMNLTDVEFHPGYQLRVQTLGPFRVWRGTTEIDSREWRRVKARQLFQLLLTHRGRTLQREEIVDMLWPDLEPEAAQRDFKVALNAMNKALEPDRPPGAETTYVVRRGTTYGLRPGADLWLDAEEFQRLIAQADDSEDSTQMYERALDLFQGDYLPEALYEDWASEERERLLALYLRTAEKLAAAHMDQDRFDEAVALCRHILAIDECWERAYRLMMAAYAHAGEMPQALRVYETCEKTLEQELDTQPGQATRQLFQQISTGVPSKEWIT